MSTSEDYIVISVDNEDHWVDVKIVDTLDNCKKYINDPKVLEDFFGDDDICRSETKVEGTYHLLKIIKLGGWKNYEEYLKTRED